jgi:hypothetical protein
VELEIATERLRSLRTVVSPEYGDAIDHVIARATAAPGFVDRERVIAILAERAATCDYLVLRSVLLDMAAAVRQL